MNLQEVVFDHLHAVAYQGNFSCFKEIRQSVLFERKSKRSSTF